jgi:hypothetical protein
MEHRREYIEAAIAGEIASVAGAQPSCRNDMLNRAAFNLGSLGIPGSEIIGALRPAALQCGLKNGEIYATINSGMRAGRANPRPVPDDGGNSYSRPASVVERVAPAPAIKQLAVVEPGALPLCDAPDKFTGGDDDGPPKRMGELRRHVYRRGGRGVRVKVKIQDRDDTTRYEQWYGVAKKNGVTGWQAQKPAGFVSAPYLTGLDPFDPELARDLLLWPEGEKDVDTLARHGAPAFTFGGTGDGLPQESASYLSGRDVVILADNDDGGRAHAEKKAMFAHEADAASVRVVHFPELPAKCDVSDFLDAGGTIEQLHARIDAAPVWSPSPDLGPLPLIPELAASRPYPVEALGDALGGAATAIANKVQAPTELAAQSVLAAASLAAQALADVRLPHGHGRPLSLFLMSVAASGDRKSATDEEALRPIRKREHDLSLFHDREIEIWRIDNAAWQSEKRSIECSKKFNLEGRKEALRALGPEPLAPLHPIMTAPDPTIEGLAKFAIRGQASLGLFSAEGGQFTAGHGMSQDNRIKTAANLSTLWDGGPIRRVRAGDGVTILKGRRFAFHMMIQPATATPFLCDPALRDQGLLSRVLVAAPASLAGTRMARVVEDHDETAIRRYTGAILSLLEQPWPLVEGKDNELSPRVLLFSEDAENEWRQFHDGIERELGPHGRLRPIRDFAGKAPEHAARIAGVLAIVENPHAAEITRDHYARGAALARWYVEEAARLAAASMTDPAVARAARLLDWWRERPEYHDGLSLRAVMQLGPSESRSKAAAESAIKILLAHGWAQQISDRPLRWSLVASARRPAGCYIATVATLAGVEAAFSGGGDQSVAKVANVAGASARNSFGADL